MDWVTIASVATALVALTGWFLTALNWGRGVETRLTTIEVSQMNADQRYDELKKTIEKLSDKIDKLRD